MPIFIISFQDIASFPIEIFNIMPVACYTQLQAKFFLKIRSVPQGAYPRERIQGSDNGECLSRRPKESNPCQVTKIH